MITKQKILTIEYTALTLLWMAAVVSPLLFVDDKSTSWVAVHVMWVELAVVGFAFVVNRFVLMPRLFFARRYNLYIVWLTILFFALSIFVLYFDGVNAILSLFDDSFAPTPPHTMPPHDIPPHAMPPIDAPAHGATTIIPPSVSVIIFSMIVVALDMGISIASKWIITEQHEAEINQERIMTQLSNLQSQVSPHFLMNTLNNIHALVDIEPRKAKQTIIELSELMSYLLYESSTKERVVLRRELEFIGNYISLMRLRYAKRVRIDFTHHIDEHLVRIPPLLFLNFIENAFKHGIDYEQESFIDIRFESDPTTLSMTLRNSNHSSKELDNKKQHGLGIKNCRKRLELLYADKYSLDIDSQEDIYIVNLKIPIQ